MNYCRNLDLSSIEYVCEETGKLLIEKWRDVSDYEGLYQVSDLGRVKSLSRKIKSRNRVHKLKERILRQFDYDVNYLKVALCKDTTRKYIKVHVLVAMEFLEHVPCGFKVVVDHINNIKTDNRLKNLQLTTNRENCSKDRKSKSSKYVGVDWRKSIGLWVARIQIENKNIHLGAFKSEYDAHLAYQNKLKTLKN